MLTCWVTAMSNVMGSHSVELKHTEAVITFKKSTLPYHTIPYPTYPMVKHRNATISATCCYHMLQLYPHFPNLQKLHTQNWAILHIFTHKNHRWLGLFGISWGFCVCVGMCCNVLLLAYSELTPPDPKSCVWLGETSRESCPNTRLVGVE